MAGIIVAGIIETTAFTAPVDVKERSTSDILPNALLRPTS